jgi:hypothetical protein
VITVRIVKKYSFHETANLNNLFRELIEGVEEDFGKALHHVPAHKRNPLTDLLDQVGPSVAAIFQPYIEGLKQV